MTETKMSKPRKKRESSAVKTKKIKTTKEPAVQVPEEPLPANVYSFFTKAVNDYEEDEGDTPIVRKPTKMSSFEETMAKNAEIQRKLTDERAKNNKNVLRSYRIK